MNPPGNFTTGSLTFPAQPVPQYAVIDLGPGNVVDMNDEGDVLICVHPPIYDEGVPPLYAVWSGGNLMDLPQVETNSTIWNSPSNDGYEWDKLADDGTVMGYMTTDFGSPAYWRPETNDVEFDYVDYYYGSIVLDTWPVYYDPQGYIYTAAEYYDGDLTGFAIEQWDMSSEDDATEIGNTLDDGDILIELANITGADGTTHHTLSADFTEGEDDWGNEQLYVQLYMDDAAVGNATDYTYFTTLNAAVKNFTVVGNTPVIALTNDGHGLLDGSNTLYYPNGSGGFSTADLTANSSSSTPLTFTAINSLGMGLDDLWVDNNQLKPMNYLPAWDFNPDLSLNLTALGVNMTTTGTPLITVNRLASTGVIAATISDSGNSSNNHATIGPLMEDPFIDPVTKTVKNLRVDSAFNKQQLDSSTGYAIPDCANVSLIASGGNMTGHIVVTGLQKGFFGINPNVMPASFFTGANVTIAKLAVNDTETGNIESGQVRFYAVKALGTGNETYWEIPTTTTSGNVTSLVNLVPEIYAGNSTVPRGSDVQYYVEGIAPGPITLQYTYTNGNITLTQTQKFPVATYQDKYAWEQEIRQQILLQTSGNVVDMNNYYPDWATTGGIFLFYPSSTRPFEGNYRYIQQVYEYYGELYNENNHFLWAGLAHLGGGPVYGGLVDSEYLRTVPLGNVTDFGVISSLVTTDQLNDGINYVQDNLIYAHYSIYDDLAWQFRAYQASGIWALRWTHEQGKDVESGLDKPIKIAYWDEMYHGDWSSNISLVQDANYWLIYREQSVMAQRGWDRLYQPVTAYAWIETIPSLSVTKVLSDLALAPLASGPSFRTVEGPTADIAVFSNRWDWMVGTTHYTPIWTQWLGLSPTGRTNAANTSVYNQAKAYSFYYYWLNEPILGY